MKPFSRRTVGSTLHLSRGNLAFARRERNGCPTCALVTGGAIKSVFRLLLFPATRPRFVTLAVAQRQLRSPGRQRREQPTYIQSPARTEFSLTRVLLLAHLKHIYISLSYTSNVYSRINTYASRNPFAIKYREYGGGGGTHTSSIP